MIYLDGNDFIAMRLPQKDLLYLLVVPGTSAFTTIKIRDAYGREQWEADFSMADRNRFLVQAVPESKSWPPGIYTVEMSNELKQQHLILFVD